SSWLPAPPPTASHGSTTTSATATAATRTSNSARIGACARCDFYTPKVSSTGQPIEAKHNLQRMPAAIPLTDDERAAVEDGQATVDQFLARLADVATPAGATPRQLCARARQTVTPDRHHPNGKQVP